MDKEKIEYVLLQAAERPLPSVARRDLELPLDSVTRPNTWQREIASLE